MDQLRLLIISTPDDVASVPLDDKEFELAWGRNDIEMLDSYAQEKPNIMLMTVRSFQENGIDFCLQARKRDALKEIPIILLGKGENLDGHLGTKFLGIEGHCNDLGDGAVLAGYIRDAYRNKARQSKKMKTSQMKRISLTGELGSMSISEVLQTLEQSRKSGVLYLHEGAKAPAKIYFQQGRAVSANFGPYRGKTAFYLILTRTHARFRFEETAEQPEPNIFEDVLVLLMTGYQKLDEYQWLEDKLKGHPHLLFFKLAIVEGVLTKAILEEILSRTGDDGASLKETLLSDADWGPALQEVEKLYAQGTEFIAVSETGQESRRECRASPHEDAILQRLLLSLSLLSMEQVNECLQIQVQEKLRGIERGLADIARERGCVDSLTLSRLQRLQNEDGENLFYGYEIQEKIGEGGLGVVYRARQLSLKRDVAIKIFAQELGSNSTAIVRFMREAEIATELNHANIVKAVDFGNLYGLYYFIMEYVCGDSLESLIQSRRVFTDVEVLDISLDVASALVHMWQKNIIYRDLKPGNIIITANGAKICDLGLAKEILKSESITTPGELMGTPAYIAPEVFREDPIDYRADVYALGVTMYAMTTGELPFQAKEKTVLFHQHAAMKPIMPKKKNTAISPRLNDLIMKYLSKSPDDRCKSPDNFLREMKELRTRMAKKAGKTPPPAARSPSPIENLPADATPKRARKFTSRRLLAAVAIVLSLMIFAYVQRQSSPVMPSNTREAETPPPAPEPGPIREIPELAQKLQNPDFSVRRQAVLALAASGEAEAIPILLSALSDEDPRVRDSVTDALGSFGERALPLLIEKLKDDPNPRVRREAAIAMAGTKIRKAASELVQAMSDPSSEVRAGAARALGILKDYGSYKVLISGLNDPDPAVREECAVALRAIQERMHPESSKYREIENSLNPK